MTPTVQQIAAVLCVKIYDYPTEPPITWDAETAYGNLAPCYWRMKMIAGRPFIVCRGSDNEKDWLNDFAHLAIPVRDPLVRWVHPGFNAGTDDAISEILALLTDAQLAVATICGHSLGAAHADVITAKLVARGKRPNVRVVFGEPRPGFSYLCGLAAEIVGYSYENAKPNGDADDHDLVTDVPFRLPWLFRYTRPTPKLQVYAAPAPNDSWLALKYHHMRLYRTAFGADGLAV